MPDDNEQLNIREYKQSLELLDHFRKRIESGEILSMLIVCEQADGSMCGGTTATQNQFAVAGYMQLWAMRRLGMVGYDDLRNLGIL